MDEDKDLELDLDDACAQAVGVGSGSQARLRGRGVPGSPSSLKHPGQVPSVPGASPALDPCPCYESASCVFRSTFSLLHA